MRYVYVSRNGCCNNCSTAEEATVNRFSLFLSQKYADKRKYPIAARWLSNLLICFLPKIIFTFFIINIVVKKFGVHHEKVFCMAE